MHKIEQQKEPSDQRERVTIVRRQDLDISYYSGHGNGGQAKNKVKTGVQIKHRYSGAIGRASDSRSLDENKRSAFERLLKDPRMKFFISQAIYEVNHRESLEATVERELNAANLRVEVKDENGRWTEVGPEYFKNNDRSSEAGGVGKVEGN